MADGYDFDEVSLRSRFSSSFVPSVVITNEVQSIYTNK